MEDTQKQISLVLSWVNEGTFDLVKVWHYDPNSYTRRLIGEAEVIWDLSAEEATYYVNEMAPSLVNRENFLQPFRPEMKEKFNLMLREWLQEIEEKHEETVSRMKEVSDEEGTENSDERINAVKVAALEKLRNTIIRSEKHFHKAHVLYLLRKIDDVQAAPELEETQKAILVSLLNLLDRMDNGEDAEEVLKEMILGAMDENA